jgi:hypothetical protein
VTPLSSVDWLDVSGAGAVVLAVGPNANCEPFHRRQRQSRDVSASRAKEQSMKRPMTKIANVAPNADDAMRPLRDDELDAVNGGSQAVGESAAAHSSVKANTTNTNTGYYWWTGPGFNMGVIG